MDVPPNPFMPPRAPEIPERVPFSSIPSYRRNGTASALLLLSLFLAFAGPFAVAIVFAAAGGVLSAIAGLLFGAPLLFVCVVVLTGDVYYDTYDANGQLKKWGVANKVVAALIVVGWAYSIVSRLLG